MNRLFRYKLLKPNFPLSFNFAASILSVFFFLLQLNFFLFSLFQATREFIEKVNAKFRRKLGPVTWSMAVRFLFARKFDVARSLALFEQHELTRQREGLTRFDPTSEPLHSELLTGKFTILVRFCLWIFFLLVK